jgi:beta-lactam-binding protein with PASTA domain
VPHLKMRPTPEDAVYVDIGVHEAVVHWTSFMPFRTRVWGAGKLLVLVGALMATYFLFAAVAMRVALRAREVQVPDLVGQTVNDASQRLNAIGLTLRVDDNRKPDSRIPADRIMQQEPLPGVQARRQRTVRVWISAGARATTVPALIGQTERTARIRAQQDGLEIGPISEFRSPEYATDAIVAQQPPPTTRGAAVSLLVNRGEQATTFVMPDLIGVNGERAAEVLRTRGFRVSIVGQQPYPGVPPGVVVRQQPPGGFQVGPSDGISLEVSR